MIPISLYVRAILVVFTMLATWMVAWLAAAGDAIEALLPAPFASSSAWMFAWGVVAVLCATGSVTGKDIPARAGFASLAVICVMGAVTLLVDGQPMQVQFWRFGLAATLAASCFILLLSPLRTPPKHEGFPDAR